jgi:hypothetical protein
MRLGPRLIGDDRELCDSDKSENHNHHEGAKITKEESNFSL